MRMLAAVLTSMLLLERSLSCGQAGRRHTKGRAAHVVEAHAVEKLNRPRVAPVFTTDAGFEAWVGAAALLHSHAHELAHACLVHAHERIVLEQSRIEVFGQESTAVVAGEAEG